MIHALPKHSHVTKDTMAKLLVDFTDNQAKRYLRSSSDLDVNFHLYRIKEKSKANTVYIDTLNSENFQDAVFNNTEVMCTYIKNCCFVYLNSVNFFRML